LKIQLKGHHLDTIEAIVAESQTVLNSVTEYDFQDAFIKWQERWEGAYARKVTTSRAMVAIRPKVSF
jgi:hypothetical protein